MGPTAALLNLTEAVSFGIIYSSFYLSASARYIRFIKDKKKNAITVGQSRPAAALNKPFF